MRLEELIADYRQRRDALELFDANCWLGAPLEPVFPAVGGPDWLKAGLARRGIRRAVVSHTMGKQYDATAGNEILLQTVQEDDAWFAAAVLVPEARRTRPWKDELRALAAAKTRLVRLFPKSHNFLLSRWYLGDLLETLEACAMPLVLWHTEASWDAVAELCRAHPALPIIVEGTGRKLFYDNRVYYRMLERFSNFYLETHNITNFLGLDDLVRHFGSERLIFGSHFPCQDPNAAIMPLTHGRLTEADKANIARGNLQRLIAGVHA